MTTVVTRAAKGSHLTWGEVDANFTNLNENKVETINPTSSGTLTHSGDIVLSGSGKRITGDFSNGTIANRLMFQTSTVNGTTEICAVPSGAGQQASIVMLGKSSGANCSILRGLVFDGSETSLRSAIDGVGSYVPMTFYTGGSERMRIDTSGNVGIGVVAKVWGGGKAIDIGKSGAIFGDGQYYDWTAGITQNGYRLADGSYKYKYAGQYFSSLEVKSTGFRVLTSPTSSIADDATVADLKTLLNADLVNGLTVNQPVGLGYGTGSGGTVTQATSKSTAVTLNKPTGQITMNGAALAAGASVQFTVNNSLVDYADNVLLTLNWSGNYRAHVISVVHGIFIIQLTNTSGTSASDAVLLNFAIIKGATA